MLSSFNNLHCSSMGSPSSSLFFLFLFLLGSASFIIGSDSSLLIQKTCQKTKYYKTCVSYLKSDPTSSTTTDAKGLAIIMVGVGMTNATATSSYLSAQLLGTTNNALMRKALKECADKYSFAAEALQACAQDLGTEAYDYAYIRVMAAFDYPNACHNAFKHHHGLAYPRDLATREKGLKRICNIVWGMIDLMV